MPNLICTLEWPRRMRLGLTTTGRVLLSTSTYVFVPSGLAIQNSPHGNGAAVLPRMSGDRPRSQLRLP